LVGLSPEIKKLATLNLTATSDDEEAVASLSFKF
jgi:hypothetical protein